MRALANALTKAVVMKVGTEPLSAGARLRRRQVRRGAAQPRGRRRPARLRREAPAEVGRSNNGLQQDPGRQPRRDRLARHAHRQGDGLSHRRGLFRRRQGRAARRLRRRGGAHRPAAGRRELSQHRPHPRGRAQVRRRRDPSRATASSPRTRPSPRPARRPAWSSSARRRPPSPPWATRPPPSGA